MGAGDHLVTLVMRKLTGVALRGAASPEKDITNPQLTKKTENC